MNITFIVPTFNESSNIKKLIFKIFSVSSPDFVVELLIIDGGSSDETIQIIKSLMTKISNNYFRLNLLNNPYKLQAGALNIGLANASYELCVRLDAHIELGSIKSIRSSLISTYDLLVSNATCSVGYKQRLTITFNLVQNSLFCLSLSPFLSGLRSYRLAISNKFSKTSVWLFALLNTRALAAGPFVIDETPNEDMGFNERLCEFTGLPLFLDVSFPIYYYSRNDFYSLFKQYFRYAFSRSTRRLTIASKLSFFFSIIRPTVFLLSLLSLIFLILNHSLLLFFYIILLGFIIFQIYFDHLNYFNIDSLNILKKGFLFLGFLLSPITLIVVYFSSFSGSLLALIQYAFKKSIKYLQMNSATID